MPRDERRAFSRALFAALQAAFPFEDRPARKIILCELGKNCSKVNLTVTKRAEAPSARNPGLIASVDALSATRPKLGIFHMKHLDAFVVNVYVLQVIELLQDEMAGVIKNIAAFVAI